MFLLDFLCNDCKQIILEVSYIHVGGECLRSGHILQQLPIAQQLTQEQTATTFRQASSNQLTHYSMSHQWMVIQVFIGYCSTTLANNYSFISHNDYISRIFQGHLVISYPDPIFTTQLNFTALLSLGLFSPSPKMPPVEAQLNLLMPSPPSLVIRMYNYQPKPLESCLRCCTSLGLHPSSLVFDSNPSVSCQRAEVGVPNNSCVQCYIRILYEFGMVLEFGPNCVYIQVRIHTHQFIEFFFPSQI